MRKGYYSVAFLGMVFTASMLPAGCIDYLAENYTPLTDPKLATWKDGGPDADGGPPPGCIPSENVDPVADTCGVFVSPLGNDSDPGTKDKPKKTFKAALAKDSTVYACAGAVPFEEAVTLDKKVVLFGGFDCASGWSYDASKKAQLTAGADDVPLMMTSAASGSAVYDFAITAADAMKPGGSSIAVLDDGADLDLTRCDVIAGKGAAGAAGEVPMGSGQKGSDAPAPMPATALDGCVMGQNGVFGGQPGQSTCGTDDTSGGLGGNGQNLTAGGVGGDAQPQPQPNATAPFDGKGGQSQGASNVCLPGDPGANGLPGAIPGAGASGIGDITPAGYQAPAATPGQSAGSHGYGGGGGGGAKKCANGSAGPAGGGGGAGGCGGQPGAAGHSAGSSFGIVALNAALSLDTVKITTADGGTGGGGGDGQPGGQGGNGGVAGSSGGDGSVSACGGGKGGQGGRGSSGGGGLGGHSIGVAFKGKALKQVGVTVDHGNGGPGGIGGDMDQVSPGIVGSDGLGCKTLDFADATSCVK